MSQVGRQPPLRTLLKFWISKTLYRTNCNSNHFTVKRNIRLPIQILLAINIPDKNPYSVHQNKQIKFRNHFTASSLPHLSQHNINRYPVTNNWTTRCTWMHGELTDATTAERVERALDHHLADQLEILLYKKNRKFWWPLNLSLKNFWLLQCFGRCVVLICWTT